MASNLNTYVMLVVQNMQTSIDFYKTFLQKTPEFTSPRWSQFRLENFLLGLHASDSWSDPTDPLRKYGSGQKGVSFGFFIQSMQDYLKHLNKSKIKVIHGPRMTGLGDTIYITDPDGHYIQICQPITKK